MGSKPITQRAGTKYGSAPVNNEVTVDAGGKEIARFPRMSPLKNSALVKGAGDVGYSKNQPVEFDMESLEMDKKDKGVTVSPAKQNRPATWSQDETSEGNPTVEKGKEKTRNKTFADLEAEGITVTDEMKQWAKDNPDAPRDQVGTGEFEPDKITPGEKKTETYQGNLYRQQTGKARSSFGSRQDKRQTLSETRKEKRGDIRAARAEMKAGNITQEEFQKRKKQAKLDMANQRVKEFNTQKKNREYAQQQGAAPGGEVRLDDVAKTFGDYEKDDARQMSMGLAQQKAERVRNQAAAADAKSYFKAKAGLLTDDSFTIGSGLGDFKTNTPSLTKPKSLMYDLSSIGNDSFSQPEEQNSFGQPRIFSKSNNSPFQMKGFGSKNKK